MRLVADARALARFVGGLKSFLQWRITPEEARAIVRERLGRRPEMFLRTVEHGVFRNPRSPYLPLFRRAGIAMGDLEKMARADGVEATLHELRRADVYVTFEEFKGRRPIVRDGLELPVTARDFDNPTAGRSFGVRSSGSTGRATRTVIDLDHMIAEVPAKTLETDAVGAVRAPTALWRGVPPAAAGVRNMLFGCAMGNVPRRWFTPVSSQQMGASWRTRAATGVFVRGAALCGTRLPQPELVPLDRADVIADWAAEALRAEGSCAVRCFVSMAVRVCLAAAERGTDLSGATFLAGGEPATRGKMSVVTGAGARLVPGYAMNELGVIGVGCARPADANDMHVAKDLTAVIVRPLQVAGWPAPVDALYLTTLQPHAPKMMLNVETDDCGVIQRRSCGCPLEEAGYDEHLLEVRSYRKLTGEGVTLVQTEAVRVLEEVLPGRFGGSPVDY